MSEAERNWGWGPGFGRTIWLLSEPGICCWRGWDGGWEVGGGYDVSRAISRQKKYKSMHSRLLYTAKILYFQTFLN